MPHPSVLKCAGFDFSVGPAHSNDILLSYLLILANIHAILGCEIEDESVRPASSPSANIFAPRVFNYLQTLSSVQACSIRSNSFSSFYFHTLSPFAKSTNSRPFVFLHLRTFLYKPFVHLPPFQQLPRTCRKTRVYPSDFRHPTAFG